MSDKQPYDLQIKDQVCSIWLNNPPANLMTLGFMHGLETDLQKILKQSALNHPRVIFLASKIGNVFSHGLDPSDILALAGSERKKVFLALCRLIKTVWLSHIPVVVDVNGAAFAGGAVLAVLGDFVIMSRQAVIAFSEVKVGLPLPAMIQSILRAKTSPASWSETILLGKNITADKALQFGFANNIYNDAGEQEKLRQEFFGKITRLPREVMAQNLKLMRQPYQETFTNVEKEVADIEPFLADDFLGKGLRGLSTKP